MDPAKRLYVDFEPTFETVQGKEEDTVLIHLPGFSNEQLRVEADAHGNLRARGERPLDDVQWSRFTADFRLPPDCDVDSIRAEFEDDTLYVILPKRIPAPAAQKSSDPLPPPTPPLKRKKSAAPPPTAEAPREKQEKEEEKGREVGGETKVLERPRRRTLLLNVAVAVAVLVGMGIYVIFKALRKPGSN